MTTAASSLNYMGYRVFAMAAILLQKLIPADFNSMALAVAYQPFPDVGTYSLRKIEEPLPAEYCLSYENRSQLKRH